MVRLPATLVRDLEEAPALSFDQVHTWLFQAVMERAATGSTLYLLCISVLPLKNNKTGIYLITILAIDGIILVYTLVPEIRI